MIFRRLIEYGRDLLPPSGGPSVSESAAGEKHVHESTNFVRPWSVSLVHRVEGDPSRVIQKESS